MKNQEIYAAQLERQLLIQLNHPNIIRLEDDFEDENYFCFIMRLMANDLREAMNKVCDALHEKLCRSIFKQIVDAVVHCHKNGVIHRDIKMENILLDIDD